MMLTAASHRKLKYKQIQQKIGDLKRMVKDKVSDGICHNIEITFKHWTLLSMYLMRDITFKC